MFRRVSVRPASAPLVAFALLAACSDGGSCPPLTRTTVGGGSWTSATSGDGQLLGDGGTSFPHGRNAATMVVDHDASVVTVTARVDGAVVVERWAMRR